MSEISEYKANLSQVEALLEAEPSEELETVRRELVELIEQLEKQTGSPEEPRTDGKPQDPRRDEKPEKPTTPVFAIGTLVTDGQFKGRVVSISGTQYTVRSGRETREFPVDSLKEPARKAKKQTATDKQLEKAKSKWQAFSSDRKRAKRKA